MYLSTKIYDREANCLHRREASWVVRTESGLNKNVLDTNNIRLMERLNLYFNILYPKRRESAL